MSKTSTLNELYKVAQSVYFEENSIEEYKSKLELFRAREPELSEYLTTLKIPNLKGVCQQLGCFFDSSDKKARLIEKIVDSLRGYFLLGQSISYVWGESTHAEAEQKALNNIDAEFLKSYYSARKAKEETERKADQNPETMEEFNIFIRKYGEDKLSFEQREKYDQLRADVTLRIQQKEQERNAVVSKVNIENVEFELCPTKHSKTGADIFTVRMINRVERDEFTELRTKAKQLGGYYSRYTDKSATPPIYAGFNFNSEENAKAFIGLKKESASALPVKEERKEEVQKNAAETMRERGEKMIEKATESLNQERRANTHRQADQAQRSEDKARGEIVFGQKMLLIADGLESGNVKYLHAISNGKQIEQLESLLNRAYQLRVPYNERRDNEKDPALDVNFVAYPFPKYGLSVIESVFMPHLDTAGLKQDAGKVLKEAKYLADKNGYVELTGEYTIRLFKKAALKLSDKWEQSRILDTIKDYERIQKMGLTDLHLLKTALREYYLLSQGAGISEEQKKDEELKALEREFIGKKISGFFPTPKPLIEKMFSMAKVFEGETICEPSAGLGHIAEAIREKFPQNKLDVIEFNHSLSSVLEKKCFGVVNMDFLEVEEVSYDVFFMNPPFENNQDIDHVLHAYSLLKSGGRLVAIMAGNKTGSKTKVVEFMDFVNDHGYMLENESGSFKSAFNSTGVNTVTVYLEKPITV